jgi:hypothetical protein
MSLARAQKHKVLYYYLRSWGKGESVTGWLAQTRLRGVARDAIGDDVCAMRDEAACVHAQTVSAGALQSDRGEARVNRYPVTTDTNRLDTVYTEHSVECVKATEK